MSDAARSLFERATPILRVKDMAKAVAYYVDVLGFKNAEWGNEHFTSVNRDGAGIYLCANAQGNPGTWAWIGVEDAATVHEEIRAKGAIIQQGPRNYQWALEIHVRDVDGNVLRIGSEPLDRPYDEWRD